jgi:hypothetical protein
LGFGVWGYESKCQVGSYSLVPGRACWYMVSAQASTADCATVSDKASPQLPRTQTCQQYLPPDGRQALWAVEG